MHRFIDELLQVLFVQQSAPDVERRLTLSAHPWAGFPVGYSVARTALCDPCARRFLTTHE